LIDREMLARLAFWGALLFAVVMAVLPKPPHTPIDQFGDKFEHMLAFGTLAALAAAGYLQTPLLRIAERLSFFGAMIELVQSIPALHRDCDIKDWIADTMIVILVLLLAAPVRRAIAKRNHQIFPL
jgi:VanZ family protein